MLRIPSDRVTIYKFGPIFDMIGDIDVTLTSDLNFEYDIRYSFSVDGINFSNWFEDKESFLIEYKEMLFVKNATYLCYNRIFLLANAVFLYIFAPRKVINGLRKEPERQHYKSHIINHLTN